MRHTYNAGEMVGNGFYFSLDSGEQVTVGREKKTLPGPAGISWLRLPWALMLVLAPVLGFLFVVFMPLIGIGLVLKVMAEAALRQAAKLVHGLTPVAAPTQMLGQAALTRPHAEETDRSAGATDEGEGLDKELSAEVAARRQRGER